MPKASSTASLSLGTARRLRPRRSGGRSPRPGRARPGPGPSRAAPRGSRRPRTAPAAPAGAWGEALAAAGVGANRPLTVLADGDAGLWRLQREGLPGAKPVLGRGAAAGRVGTAAA